MILNSKMLFWAFVFVGFVLTNFYYFPIDFWAFPYANTKQMLAACGAVLFFIDTAKHGSLNLDNNYSTLYIMAIVVSIFGFMSVAYNSTNDYAYATYIMSMFVWLGGAYSVCTWIRWTHEKCSVPLVCNYLIAVCIFQCVMALWMDNNHDLRDFVDSYVNQGQDLMHEIKRIYGIGSSLDVAGIRFSLALIAAIFMAINSKNTKYRPYVPLYLFSFIIIAILGNIVARTTTVGLLLGFLLFFFNTRIYSLKIFNKYSSVFAWISFVIVIAVPIVYYLYNNDETFHRQFRFAFEGFFSLIETGKWHTNSNDTLADMYVWPEKTKTWIIGDGYFTSPRFTDPYFVGEIIGGYYMGTDVGYLRFIFYFGLPGLIAFSAYFIKAGMICAERLKQAKWMFFFMVVAHFIIWFKVATDIFLCLALFLCIGKEENEEYYKEIEVEE